METDPQGPRGCVRGKSGMAQVPGSGGWKGKTPPLGKNEAIPHVSISVRGLMIQRLTDEWAEVFRLKKVLK